MQYLVKFSISGLLLIIFSYFINFYQDLYNETSTSFVKTISLAAIIMYGGFTYDMCKNLIFMQPRRFEVFKNRFKSLTRSIGVLFLLILVASAVFSLKIYGFAEAYFFGSMIFIITLGYSLTIVEKIFDVIEAS